MTWMLATWMLFTAAAVIAALLVGYCHGWEDCSQARTEDDLGNA